MPSTLQFLSHKRLYKLDTSILVDHSARARDIQNEKDVNFKDLLPFRVTLAAFCQSCRAAELDCLCGPLKGLSLKISKKEKIEDQIMEKSPLLFQFIWS